MVSKDRTGSSASRQTDTQQEVLPTWGVEISWVNTIFLTVTPILGIGGVIYSLATTGFHWGNFLLFLVMAILTGLAITAGYHRLFAHRSYRTHPWIKAFFLLFGAASVENSAYKWASDHRYHHRHEDTDADPYNINRGFFWAHMGWIFYKDATDRSYQNVEDLRKDRLIMFQDRHYLAMAIVMNMVVPTLIGALWGMPLEGFIWGGLFRVVFNHHATFLINSAAHWFGKKPYNPECTARDCWWLSFFAYGEGYHNFHHTFASDYRNGVKWYNWDPSKWIIYGLEKFGWATQLQRTPAKVIRHFENRVLEQELMESDSAPIGAPAHLN